MTSTNPEGARARGTAIRQARASRTRAIRRRVAASAVLLFLATWVLIAVVMVSGHDPALAARKVASASTASGTTGTGTTATGTTSTSSGSQTATTASGSTSSGSSSSGSSSSGTTSSSSATSGLTTRAS